MDHNTVLSYDYAKRKRRRQWTNAPLLLVISMAMQRHWSDTWGIAQCSMSRATPEATGRRHWHRATTKSVLPQRPPGQQQTNNNVIEYVPTLMAISMAIAMQRYYTALITQLRRYRAFIKATKHRHWASTCSNSINQTRQYQLFLRFHREKGLKLTCWTLIKIGVWHIELMKST